MKINPSKTLEQLEKDVWQDPDYNSHLVTECHRLRKVPLKNLTAENLRILIGQQIGLPFLIQRALDLLEQNPWAMGDFYTGDLLNSVVSIDKSFWADHEEELDRLSNIIEEINSQIETFTNEIQPKWQAIFTC